IKYILKGRSDVQAIKFAVAPRRIDPVGQKDEGQFLFWIGPDKGARESRMTKTGGTGQWGRVGLFQRKLGIVQKWFVKAQPATVIVLWVLHLGEFLYDCF